MLVTIIIKLNIAMLDFIVNIDVFVFSLNLCPFLVCFAYYHCYIIPSDAELNIILQ